MEKTIKRTIKIQWKVWKISSQKEDIQFLNQTHDVREWNTFKQK